MIGECRVRYFDSTDLLTLCVRTSVFIISTDVKRSIFNLGKLSFVTLSDDGKSCWKIVFKCFVLSSEFNFLLKSAEEIGIDTSFLSAEVDCLFICDDMTSCTSKWVVFFDKFVGSHRSSVVDSARLITSWLRRVMNSSVNFKLCNWNASVLTFSFKQYQ